MTSSQERSCSFRTLTMVTLKMVSRTRTRDTDNGTGGSAIWTYNGSDISTEINTPIATNRSACIDVIDGTRNDHPLSITHNTVVFIDRVNGELAPGNTLNNKIFKDYVPELYSANPFPAHLSIPRPSDAAQGTTAKARTNPSRPVVNLPVAIVELRELPSLIKYLGTELIQRKKTRHNFHNQVGDAFMSGIYGIAPMISDIKGLLGFQESVQRRAGELERLYSLGGLKRRIRLAQDTAKSTKAITTINNKVGTLYARRQDVTTVEQWATIRWLPTTLAPRSIASKGDYEDMAKGLVLGLSQNVKGLQARNDAWSDLSDIWNLMPWSWMADWFGNVGDFIDSNRNTIPAQSSRINVMTTTRTIRTFIRHPLLSNPWALGGNACFMKETKVRTPTSGTTIAASLPFLSEGQLSILGALGLQRLRVR